jgi:predicted Rossmann-fold nucleotide-binding protein
MTLSHNNSSAASAQSEEIQVTTKNFPVHFGGESQPLGANVRRFSEIIFGIVQGKPFVPSKQSEQRLFGAVQSLVTNMVAMDRLPDAVDAYCLERPPAKPDPWPRVFGFNPAPEPFVKASQHLIDVLGAHGTCAVNVLGAAPNQSIWLATKPGGNVEIVFDYMRDREAGVGAMAKAALNLAIPGEFRAADQLLRFIQMRQDGSGAGFAPLIIENLPVTDEQRYGENTRVAFWDPLLRVAGIHDSRGHLTPKADALGIIVTTSPEETIAQARQILAPIVINARLFPAAPPIHRPGAPIRTASQTDDKHTQIAESVKARGLNVVVEPAETLVDSLKFPPEVKGTYEYHAVLKAAEAVRAMIQMPDLTRRRNLKASNASRQAGSFLGEDSGFNTDESKVLLGKQFDDVTHLVAPRRRFPGVETGPAIWSSGIKVFFRRLGAEVERIAQVEQRAPNYGATNFSMMALTPVEADAEGMRPVVLTFAVRRGNFSALEPVDRAKNSNYRIGDYLYPAGGDGKNETQLGKKWTAEIGTKPGALQSLAILAGIEAGHKIEPNRISDFRTGIFSVEPFSQDDLKAIKKATRGKVTVGAPAIIRSFADVQREIFAPHDAVALKFGTNDGVVDFAKEFLRAATIFFPAVVAKQVRDKFMLNKTLATFDDDKGISQRLMAIVNDLHKIGGIPQEPRTLIATPRDIAEFADMVSKVRKNQQFRYPPYSYAHGASILVDDGSPAPAGYQATILASAHLKGSHTLNLTADVAEGLGKMGVPVISGGGLNGGMGAVTNTILRLHGEGYNVHHTAITTPHVQFLEGGDQIRNQVHRYILTNNIHTREELLCGLPHAGILVPSGSGGMSELTRLQAIMFGVVANKAAPHIAPEDQIAVIVDPVIPGGRRRYFDAVIKNMPEAIMADPRIHHVQDAAAALDIVAAHRARLTKEGRLFQPA